MQLCKLNNCIQAGLMHSHIVPKTGALWLHRLKTPLKNLRNLVVLASNLAQCRIRMLIRSQRTPQVTFNKIALTTTKSKNSTAFNGTKKTKFPANAL